MINRLKHNSWFAIWKITIITAFSLRKITRLHTHIMGKLHCLDATRLGGRLHWPDSHWPNQVSCCQQFAVRRKCSGSHCLGVAFDYPEILSIKSLFCHGVEKYANIFIAPSGMHQTIALSSSPPVTTMRPSGEKRHVRTPAPLLCNGGFALLPELMSHRQALPSSEQDINLHPSGANSTLLTEYRWASIGEKDTSLNRPDGSWCQILINLSLKTNINL